MSKVKHDGTTHYEVLYIVSNQYTEDEVIPISESIEKFVTDCEGKITYRENWGKKKLAYPIKNFNHGYYCLFEFDLMSEKLRRVEDLLRLSGKVLRHQIFKKRVKTQEEIAEEKKVAEKIASKKIEEKTREDKEKKDIKKEEKKVELKDLDEKLDKILDAGDLL